MNCRVCGSALEQTGSREGRTGAVHDRYYCPDCRAHGLLSANLTGCRTVYRRGQALRQRERGATRDHNL